MTDETRGPIFDEASEVLWQFRNRNRQRDFTVPEHELVMSQLQYRQLMEDKRTHRCVEHAGATRNFRGAPIVLVRNLQFHNTLPYVRLRTGLCES